MKTFSPIPSSALRFLAVLLIGFFQSDLNAQISYYVEKGNEPINPLAENVSSMNLDDMAPVPDMEELPVLQGSCSVFATPPTAVDNFIGPMMANTTDPMQYDAPGTYTINWVFEDGNGNRTTQKQMVIVEDMTPPVFQDCPANIVMSANSSDCMGKAMWTPPVAMDECQLSPLRSNYQPGDAFPIGTTTVWYAATDARGNLNTCSFDVTVNNVMTHTVIENAVSCHGSRDGSIALTISGGTAPYFVDWNNDGSNDSENLNNIKGGTYFATIIDANGCEQKAEAFVLEPEPLHIVNDAVIDPTFCGTPTGEIHISATGGTLVYNYVWNDGYTQPDRNAIGAGVYSVTVSDENGCMTVETYTLNDPSSPLIQVEKTNNVSCSAKNNGSADISVQLQNDATTYSVSWSNGNNDEDLMQVSAGNYYVLVTDNNNCTASKIIGIKEPSTIKIYEEVHPVSCKRMNDGAINLSINGGTAPYTIAWNNNENSEDLSGLVAGTYSVFVVDAEGCMTTSDITVNSPEALEVKAVVEDELFGQDGNIQLSVNGGTAPYQYSWSNGATSENLNNIHSGNYSITVSDRNGCNETLQMSVSGNEELGENTMLHMRMFPNPATGEMNIQFSKTVNGTLQVVGVNGKQLIRTSLSTIQYQLDLSQYAEGLFYMVVTPENGQAVTTSFTISK
jgi:hypothetical protein